VFDLYLKELLEWNKKFNLTAITDPEEIRIKHFEDSLTLLQAIQLKDQSVIDVGTGAGFPGIPLKIVCPEIKLTLLEATKKKVEFLKHIVSILNLQEVEIIWGRAEEIIKRKRESFDLALSRAVAKLNVLCELCLPL
jgi:16S rRNA (guanine527-N7)-methyltransferase